MKTKPCEDCNKLFEYKHPRSVCCLKCREKRRKAWVQNDYAAARVARKNTVQKEIHPKYLHRHWREDENSN